jgi:tRNA(Arg) A34 adenosine deaminase TadA
MSSQDSGDAPIYDSLVGEQGDVLAEARQAAEEAQRTTQHALNDRGFATQAAEFFPRY